MRRALLAAALATAVAGCHEPFTEVVVIASADSDALTQLQSLVIQVTGVTVAGNDADGQPIYSPIYVQSPTLRLSSAPSLNGPCPNCFTLPVTIALIPGMMKPHETVRVAVLGEGAPTTDGKAPKFYNSAIFTFLAGRNTLNMVMFGACADELECYAKNQACSATRQCYDVTVMPSGTDAAVTDDGATDGTISGDIAMSQDDGAIDDLAMSMSPPDLTGADLTSSPDMSMAPRDMAMSTATDMSGSRDMATSPDMSMGPKDMATSPSPSPDMSMGPHDMATGPSPSPDMSMGSPMIVLTPPTLPFGTVSMSNPMMTLPIMFQVQNVGTGTSGNIQLGLGGANPGQFVLNVGSCGLGLGTMGSCFGSVSFLCNTNGTFNATLTAMAAPGGTGISSINGTCTP